MPKLKSPTIKPVVCTICGQAGGQLGQVPLRKIGKGEYTHDGTCPKLPRRHSKIILPTAGQVVAVEQTKEA